MLGETVFEKSPIPVLVKSLDASMLRSRTIANNIANVNTPGYQRVEVSFEDELRKALDQGQLSGMQTNDKHLPLGKLGLSGLSPKSKNRSIPPFPAASTTWISTWKWQSLRKTRFYTISAQNF